MSKLPLTSIYRNASSNLGHGLVDESGNVHRWVSLITQRYKYLHFIITCIYLIEQHWIIVQSTIECFPCLKTWIFSALQQVFSVCIHPMLRQLTEIGSTHLSKLQDVPGAIQRSRHFGSGRVKNVSWSYLYVFAHWKMAKIEAKYKLKHCQHSEQLKTVMFWVILWLETVFKSASSG